MRILFENAALLPGGARDGSAFALVEGGRFSYVGKEKPAGEFDRIIDCRGGLLIPAFYNTHCHAAMTLFRGYADDLPLAAWLGDKILPAEDRLDADAVYWASLAAAAEMISGGVVSFSDMYMFEDVTARAVLESGMKANLARGLVSFEEGAGITSDKRFVEAVSLVREFNGAGDGKLRVDMALHAEYTNVSSYCRAVAEYCDEANLRMQIHLSETRDEHEGCIKRHGMTPTRFFDASGVLDLPLTAAHCVWVSDDDIDLLAEKKVFISHNPSSNLKLGSGIMPYRKMCARRMNISLGTDGAASNNSLSILKELQFAALLHKGVELDAAAAPAAEMIECATLRGAQAQGREDCGKIAPGYRADAILIPLDGLSIIPADGAGALVYGADRSCVAMTMCDGRILYERGEYKSIDIECVKYNLRIAAERVLG